jgi:hypothetical protein
MPVEGPDRTFPPPQRSRGAIHRPLRRVDDRTASAGEITRGVGKNHRATSHSEPTEGPERYLVAPQRLSLAMPTRPQTLFDPFGTGLILLSSRVNFRNFCCRKQSTFLQMHEPKRVHVARLLGVRRGILLPAYAACAITVGCLVMCSSAWMQFCP